MEEMRELIEDYQVNLKKLWKLQAKLINLLDYNTKITASYEFNAGGSSGGFSSKVERHALKIYEIEEQLMEVGNKVATVDNAQKILTNKEKEVIELVKIHRNKLTKIGKILDLEKKQVFDIRNRAFKKMSEYIKNK